MSGRSADVVVIGAGIVGVAIAYELARRGASVEVIDRRPVGMGATQASAGMLAPYIEAGEGGPLLDLTTRSLALFDDFIAGVSSESGMPVPYRRTGTLNVATDEGGVAALRETADLLARMHVPAAFLDAASVRSEEPLLADHASGGLRIDTHGFVAAAELTSALAHASRLHGATFIEPGVVHALRPVGPDILIETDRGARSAPAVVVAAGSWSGDIAVAGAAVRVPVKPIRGQLLHLRWAGTPLGRVTWSSRCYLVPWDDGTLLMGATTEDAGFHEATTVAGVRDLLDAVCDLLPQARSVGFDGARVGLRPGTPDGLPVIGFSGAMPNVMYATGHFRNGVMLAPLTAKLVADALLERRLDPLLEHLSPARFGAL
jgi:glycine oxidase